MKQYQNKISLLQKRLGNMSQKAPYLHINVNFSHFDPSNVQSLVGINSTIYLINV